MKKSERLTIWPSKFHGLLIGQAGCSMVFTKSMDISLYAPRFIVSRRKLLCFST